MWEWGRKRIRPQNRSPSAFPAVDNTNSAQYLVVGNESEACACPWDCQDTPNGFVDIADLFKLFGDWFMPGPCDFDGNNLSDINDLFEMFGNWGICP